MTIRTALTYGWTLGLAEDADPTLVSEAVRAALPVPATVPGTVHTDLLAAGLIPDPYLDRNELAVDWVGRVPWVYQRTLEHTAVDGETTVLAFDGLDTVATVSVNGTVVARTENMHRRYEVPVSLHEGHNQLTVRFDSAWAFGEAERERALPNQYPGPFNYLRKMACNFGWDWGPTLVTAGIWRPVALVRSTGPRLVSVAPRISPDGEDWVAEFDLQFSSTVDGSVMATIGPVSVVAPVSGATATVAVRVGEPELWWPHDLGRPALYEASVRLRDADGGSTPRPTRTGHRSYCWSTTCRCRYGGRTGSRTTAFRPGSRRNGCANGSARRSRRT
jgi:beta-mannosidase